MGSSSGTATQSSIREEKEKLRQMWGLHFQTFTPETEKLSSPGKHQPTQSNTSPSLNLLLPPPTPCSVSLIHYQDQGRLQFKAKWKEFWGEQKSLLFGAYVIILHIKRRQP